MLVDKEDQSWFKCTDLANSLDVCHINTSTAKLSQVDKERSAKETGTLYVSVNSRKDRGKTLNEHILKDIIPRRLTLELQMSRKTLKIV